jgi:DNA-binding NarL/FixJ family response regulator
MKLDWPFPGDGATEEELTEFSFEYPGNLSSETIQRPAASKVRIAIIDERVLFRDCLARCLKLANDYEIATFSSVDDFIGASTSFATAIVILAMPRSAGAEEGGVDNDRMRRLWGQTPTILMSNNESTEDILAALDYGVRGILPADVTFDIAIEAIRLVQAGGTFVPRSVLMQTRNAPKCMEPYGGVFTSREVAIVDGLRKGKSNKTIAFDLSISESTVKVHLRNIMNKLRATNRTQVAMLTNRDDASKISH